MKIFLTIFFLIIAAVVVFTKCSNRKQSQVREEKFGDSLIITTEIHNDTTIKKYAWAYNANDKNHIDTTIVQSTPAGSGIKISNFYFETYKYKMYFDTALVIRFCDSAIKNTPPDTDGSYVNWSIVSCFKQMKEVAASGKPKTIELADWRQILLNRFSPLVTDTISKKIANTLLIEKFTNGEKGYHKYSAIFDEKDTAIIGLIYDYWPQPTIYLN